MQVPIEEARPGDILLFKGYGGLYNCLSWLIKKVKEPNWDKWGWHMAPVVARDTYLDAQWPCLKLSYISEAKHEIRCYRILDNPPPVEKTNLYVNNHLGKPYDAIVYIWTALSTLIRPHLDFPRIINKTYTCWETTWDALECWDFDMDDTDYSYPFITDFLRTIGEIK